MEGWHGPPRSPYSFYFLLLTVFGLCLLLCCSVTWPPLAPCTTCLIRTRRGSTEEFTLAYYSSYSCKGFKSKCTYQGVTYSICQEFNKNTCYNPQADPSQQWVYVHQGRTPEGPVLFKTRIFNMSAPVTVTLEACQLASWSSCGPLNWQRAYAANDKYICPEPPRTRNNVPLFSIPCRTWGDVRWATYIREGPSDPSPNAAWLTRVPGSSSCPSHTCNFVNFIFRNLPRFLANFRDQYGIRIAGSGADPGGFFFLKIHTLYAQAAPHSVVHSNFWEEVQAPSMGPPEPLALPLTDRAVPGTNLFLELASSISHALNVTDCFVCGGTNMGDQWPWEGAEFNVSQTYNISLGKSFRGLGKGQWTLRNRVLGHWCIQRVPRRPSAPLVGNSDCQTLTILNKSISHWPNTSSIPDNRLWVGHPFYEALTNASYRGTWSAPPGLYWICGYTAYSRLPPAWGGTCLLGQIKPAFFLLPLSAGELLGHPVYASRPLRERRSAPELKIGDWGNDWPPERIVRYYGPATWAQDRSWGYRTPIYMLNRIIRLQAVLELITNETSRALGLLAKQHTQVHNAVYQNRLALDYLLLAEGGVCGKFNLSDCCLQIDDHGDVISEIVDNVRRLAHVPVQTWEGWNFENPFSSWFSRFGTLKGMFGMIAVLVLGCMLLPCIIPLATRSVRMAIESTTKQKVASQILALRPWTWESPSPADEQAMLISGG
uniref:Uncharacterized protein n=1 Tax=Pelusios castaneus TaxID=367368 RepID=A0A8C8RPM8_9SAUR